VSPSLLIEKLESLLPEIKRSGDPGGVLLKYATEENLAPALLEKMAQQYNTAKTLAFMNKAADRGGSFSIIETEDLLTRYTQPDEQDKSASVMTWFEPASTSINASRFPDLELLEMQMALKTATAQETPEVPEMSGHEKRAAAEATRRNYETLLQVRDDNKVAAWTALEKFASILHENEFAFPQVEDDILCLMGKKADLVIPAVLAYFDNRQITVERMEKQARRAVVRDRFGIVPCLEEAWTALDTVTGVNELLKSAAAGVAELPREFRESFFDPAGPKQPAGHPLLPGGLTPDEIVLDALKSRESKKTESDSESKSESAESKERAEGEAGLNAPTFKERDSSGGGKPPRDEKPSKNDGASGGKDEGLKEDLKPLGDELNKGWDRFLDHGRKLRPMQDPLEGVGRLAELAGGGGRNRRQETIDTASDDAQFQANVERIIHTDPILSEADPELLTALANSMRQLNPERAMDYNYLSQALREGAQYGAIPHHTAKDLTTMRKDYAQAYKAESENSETLYGGASRAA